MGGEFAHGHVSGKRARGPDEKESGKQKEITKSGPTKIALMGHKKKPNYAVASPAHRFSENWLDPERATTPEEEARALGALLRRWKRHDSRVLELREGRQCLLT